MSSNLCRHYSTCQKPGRVVSQVAAGIKDSEALYTLIEESCLRGGFGCDPEHSRPRTKYDLDKLPTREEAALALTQ